MARRAAAPSAPSPARGRCRRAASCRRKSRAAACARHRPRPHQLAALLGARLQLRLRFRSRRRRARPRDGRCSKHVSHGSSEWFWNTTPRSGPGPAISRPAHSSTPVRRLQQTGDQVEQRGLAAARMADQRDELALRTIRSMSRSATNGPRFVLNVMPTPLDVDEAGDAVGFRGVGPRQRDESIGHRGLLRRS